MTEQNKTNGSNRYYSVDDMLDALNKKRSFIENLWISISIKCESHCVKELKNGKRDF